MANNRKKARRASDLFEESSSSSSSSSISGSEPDEVEEVYDVECIRTWRYNRRTKKREYYIKWRNWDEKDNTWEPEDHLSCPEPMEQFVANMTKRQRKLYTINNRDNLSGFERNAEINCMFATINTNTLPGSPASGASSRDTNTIRSSRAKFHFMIFFEDDKDEFEIVTLDELYEYRPDKAFEWLESRIVNKSSLEGRSDRVRS